MMDNRLVNDLLEAVDNADSDVREKKEIGRLLARCQLHCGHWSRSTCCPHHEWEEWIALLITPGRHCSSFLPRELDT